MNRLDLSYSCLPRSSNGLIDVDRLPSSQEVMEWFSFLEAGWVYNWGSKKPHAILHSGKHSTGFFLCKRVLQYGNLREILATCMIKELYRNRDRRVDQISGVFGSPYSSIMLAGDIGRLLGVKTYVPEKDPTDLTGKRMIFKSDDPIPEGAVLLQIEELVTTFDSGEASKQAIITGNPYQVTFYQDVAVLVHRPPVLDRKLSDGRNIVPFIEHIVGAWEPTECPVCKEGSKPVFPKKNWAELTA